MKKDRITMALMAATALLVSVPVEAGAASPMKARTRRRTLHRRGNWKHAPRRTKERAGRRKKAPPRVMPRAGCIGGCPGTRDEGGMDRGAPDEGGHRR